MTWDPAHKGPWYDNNGQITAGPKLFFWPTSNGHSITVLYNEATSFCPKIQILQSFFFLMRHGGSVLPKYKTEANERMQTHREKLLKPKTWGYNYALYFNPHWKVAPELGLGASTSSCLVYSMWRWAMVSPQTTWCSTVLFQSAHEQMTSEQHF